MEQLDYDLLFRWFVGLNIDDPVSDVTVFTKNGERFLDGEIVARFPATILGLEPCLLTPRVFERIGCRSAMANFATGLSDYVADHTPAPRQSCELSQSGRPMKKIRKCQVSVA